MYPTALVMMRACGGARALAPSTFLRGTRPAARVSVPPQPLALRTISRSAVSIPAAVGGSSRSGGNGGATGGRVPLVAWSLAGLGLIPFVFYGLQHERGGKELPPRWDASVAPLERALGLEGWRVLQCGDQQTVRRRFITYGACILSWLGAVQWGLAMAAAPPARPVRYIAAVAPALLGWGALNYEGSGTVGHSLLAGGFVGTYIIDELGVRAGWAPRWYGTLRAPLTFGVVMTTLFAAYLGRERDNVYNS